MGELTLGAFLRRSRERDGDSLSQAAEQIGCTKAHLWDMENGNSQNPSMTFEGVLIKWEPVS